MLPILRDSLNLDDPTDAQVAERIMKELGDELNLDDPMAREVANDTAKDVLRKWDIAKKAMSPPGTLGLPPLLEARRWEYMITDGAFRMAPYYDRILVLQVPPRKPKGDRRILLTGFGKKRESEGNPEGILVGAGLLALDQLRSHGIDLGHRVSFVKLAPLRNPIEVIDGHELHVILMRVGDITGSEDVAAALRNGDMTIDFDEESYSHYLRDKTGKVWHPDRVTPTEMDESY